MTSNWRDQLRKYGLLLNIFPAKNCLNIQEIIYFEEHRTENIGQTIILLPKTVPNSAYFEIGFLIIEKSENVFPFSQNTIQI